MGHEFCAEVLEPARTLPGRRPGHRSSRYRCCLTGTGIRQLAYNNDYPGRVRRADAAVGPARAAGAERPRSRLAALTEPLAVGIHAVAVGGVTERNAACVVGCGPVGLCVIAALAARGSGGDRRVRLLAGEAGARARARCDRGGRPEVRSR